MKIPRRTLRMAGVLAAGALASTTVPRAAAADVILNEYNAVNAGRYLDSDNYSGPLGEVIDKEDSYFATVPGLAGDGRIQGNGGNWFELVVAGDHVDMRGWQLRWAETNKFENNGTVVWYTPPAGLVPDQGTITLSNSPVWSDLRAGTILTFSARTGFQIDTTPAGANKNFNDFADPVTSDGSYEVTVDLSTNIGFNPQAGDWWMHVSTRDEADNASPLASTVTNAVDSLGMPESPGSFATGNDNWLFNIVNASGQTVFGPAGEVPWNEAINSRQVGKLEANPSTVVSPGAAAYNAGTSSSFGQPNLWTSGSVPMEQNFAPLRSWYRAGDFDEDGDADGADFLVWQRGVGPGVAPRFGQGDANFNGVVDSADLAIWRSAFGAAATASQAPVPEPASWMLGLSALGWVGRQLAIRSVGTLRGTRA